MFSSPWFVGIGGGILSGIIVAYISRFIFSKRDGREYAQKLSQANHEVLYAVRPGISEGVIPTSVVLKMLIEATARKYSIDMSDMYDLSDISSELIKEVMDSSFISASSKHDFCGKLTAIREDEDVLGKVGVQIREVISARYRGQLVWTLSAMAGLFTVLVTIVTIGDAGISEFESLTYMLVPAFLAILVSVVGVALMRVQQSRRESLRLSVEHNPHAGATEKDNE